MRLGWNCVWLGLGGLGVENSTRGGARLVPAAAAAAAAAAGRALGLGLGGSQRRSQGMSSRGGGGGMGSIRFLTPCRRNTMMRIGNLTGGACREPTDVGVKGEGGSISQPRSLLVVLHYAPT